MKIKKSLLAALLCGTIACTASAQISIVNTASGVYDLSTGSGSLFYTLVNPGDTLVLGTYADVNGYSLNSASYNSIAASGTLLNSRAFLAYFYNASASANFNISISANSANTAYFIYELSGVNSLAAVATGTGGSITTTAANQFVLDFAGLNNDAGAALVPNTAGGSIVTLSGVANANGSIGGGSLGAGYANAATVGAAGAKTLGWTGTGGGFFQGEVAVAFSAAPVPEPSSLAFLGGGFLTFLMARRFKKK
jgi:hypothetical protein